MGFTPDSPVDIEAAQLAAYINRFPEKSTSSEDFLGKLARAEAQGLSSAQLKMQRVSLDAIPSSSSLYAALSDWATTLGLSDGAGGYGPLLAVAGTGGVCTATGTNGSPIAADTQMVGPDGSTLYTVTALATISSGVADVSVNAITAGSSGNIAAPLALRFVSPPNGVQPSATITTSVTGGSDLEDAPDLLARIQDRLRNPPKPGTAANLRLAAEDVAGVSRAYVYERRLGTGTFDVYVFQEGTGSSRRVTDTDVLAAVDAAVLLETVTTESVTVAAAAAATGNAIRVRATPITQYPFDWDSSTGGPWTVASYDGPGKTLTVNTAVPADFIAATSPRIQVKTTGWYLPVIGTVTSITGSNLVLHFTDLPTEWATYPPQAGDPVYASADFVPFVAQAILDFIDSLGPSLASGYADTATDSWSDLIDSFQIARVAMDVEDSSGRRYLKTLVADPTIDGATTAVEATDPISTPPTFLRAASIVVTP